MEIEWHKKFDTADPALQRAGCASAAYHDHYVLVFGGRQNDSFFLDCYSVDTTGAAKPSLLSPSNARAGARAYHTVSLIGDVAWVVGGSRGDVFCDTWCFNVKTREWKAPILSGDVGLLHRTAHASCLHPAEPSCILIFGGYCLEASAGKWLQDLITLNTVTGEVRAVKPRGTIPTPRAYHSFTATSEGLCVSLFGRSENSTLIPAKHAVVIYDTKSNSWVVPTPAPGSSTAPVARSSHRTCALPGGLVVFGGAPGSTKKKERLADAHFLKVARSSSGGARPKFLWTPAHIKAASKGGRSDVKGAVPRGRAAHAQEIVGGKLFVLGGYRETKEYASDVWCGRMSREKDYAHAAVVVAARPPPVPMQVPRPGQALKALLTTGHQGAAAEVVKPLGESPWRSVRRKGQELVAGAGAGGGGGGAEGNNKRQRVAEHTGPLCAMRLAAAAKATNNSVDGVGGGSREITPETMALAELQGRIQSLHAALEVQRGKEAVLLQDKGSLQAQLDHLKSELESTDRRWREAASDCARWRQIAEEQETRASEAANKAKEAATIRHAAELEGLAKRKEAELAETRAALESLRVAKRLAESESIRVQRQVDDLMSTIDSERLNAERGKEERKGLQEQNAVLNQQLTAATAERVRALAEAQAAKEALDASRNEWNAERDRLKREIDTSKEVEAASAREADTFKRQKTSAESEKRTAEIEVERLRKAVQAADNTAASEKAKALQAKEEAASLRAELQRLMQSVEAEKGQKEQEIATIQASLQRIRNSSVRLSGSLL